MRKMILQKTLLFGGALGFSVTSAIAADDGEKEFQKDLAAALKASLEAPKPDQAWAADDPLGDLTAQEREALKQMEAEEAKAAKQKAPETDDDAVIKVVEELSVLEPRQRTLQDYGRSHGVVDERNISLHKGRPIDSPYLVVPKTEMTSDELFQQMMKGKGFFLKPGESPEDGEKTFEVFEFKELGEPEASQFNQRYEDFKKSKESKTEMVLAGDRAQLRMDLVKALERVGQKKTNDLQGKLSKQ